MKITILDGYTENPGDLSWDGVARFGNLKIFDRTSLTDEQEIIDHIGEADIVITNKTPINRHVLDSCPSIRFITVLATGYNIVMSSMQHRRYSGFECSFLRNRSSRTICNCSSVRDMS